MKRALPPVLVFKKTVKPPLLVVIVALPAVLLSSKSVSEPELLPVVIAELPAVLLFINWTSPKVDCVLLSIVAYC